VSQKKIDPMRSRLAGHSMLEALVGISIVGVAAGFYMTSSSIGLQKGRSVKLRADLHDGRQSIRSRIDCDATLDSFLPRPVTGAKCSGPVAVIGKDGKVFVDKGGSTLGEWHIAAECEDVPGSGLGLTFFATKPDGAGGFKADPATRSKSDPAKAALFDKSHPIARIFPDWARPCSEFFRPENPDNLCAPNEVATGALASDGSVICSNAPAICSNMGGTWSGKDCEFPLPEVNCPALESLVGVTAEGKAICVSTASRVDLYRVKRSSGSNRVSACCNPGDRIIACTGSREENVNDTCDEEKCGYIGAVFKNNCCVAGVDHDKGTEAVADAVCAKGT
jgi:hypothetical protein